MKEPFTQQIAQMADSMGMNLYQRFTPTEASLFLHCHINEIKNLIKKKKINYIQLGKDNVEFFGFQLIEHLLSLTTHNTINPTPNTPQNTSDRIIRAKEVQSMTGLSRTTLWRLENKNEFPHRIRLGTNSVGWRLIDIKNWINEK